MAQHNKLTFTAEYCRARHIPYRIKGEALFLNGAQVCYSLYNLTYVDIIRMIDNEVEYDPTGTHYVRMKPNAIYEVPDEDFEMPSDYDDDSNIGCKDCPDDECTGHCMSCSYRSI